MAKPNFWSSCAVAMNSWVCASTPTVSRTITGATDSPLAGDRVQPGDLVERVEHHPTDPGFDRGDQLGRRLVVAVQRDPLGREAGPQRHGQLAAAAHVQREALRRPPSGRPRCTGTPWPRSAPTRPPNAAANSAARPRKSSSSITNSGVPKRSASSRTSTPASSSAPSPARTAFRGQTAGASSSSPAASGGRGPAVSGGVWMPACSGPAGCALTAFPPRPPRSHPLRGGDAEQAQAVGQHLAGGHAQREPGPVQLGGGLVAHRQHPAGVVELVVRAGQRSSR